MCQVSYISQFQKIWILIDTAGSWIRDRFLKFTFPRARQQDDRLTIKFMNETYFNLPTYIIHMRCFKHTTVMKNISSLWCYTCINVINSNIFTLQMFKIRQKFSNISEISVIQFQWNWAWMKVFRNANANIISLHQRFSILIQVWDLCVSYT